MAGRTLNKYTRVYVDGYDLSGYSRSIEPLSCEYELADLTVPMSDAIKGYLPNQAVVSPGALNGVFDNTATSGLHAVASSQNDDRVVLVAIGDRAAPAQGDPAFMGEFCQNGYHASEDGGAVTATVPFGPSNQESLIKYSNPWGTLAHALAAADSDGNSAVGYDDGAGATTSFGGYICWQVTAGNGTATITLEHDDSSDSDGFAAVGGLTSGLIDCSSVQCGIAATTSNTTSILRYTRWQIAMTTATTVTFALGFVRARFAY